MQSGDVFVPLQYACVLSDLANYSEVFNFNYLFWNSLFLGADISDLLFCIAEFTSLGTKKRATFWEFLYIYLFPPYKTQNPPEI